VIFIHSIIVLTREIIWAEIRIKELEKIENKSDEIYSIIEECKNKIEICEESIEILKRNLF
jgi:hypothetical protein